MDNDKIQVAGFSDQALDLIKRYVSGMTAKGLSKTVYVPVVALVRRSVYFNEKGEIFEEKGERFVIGHNYLADVKKDIIFDGGDFQLAVRIPQTEKFYGTYIFDVVENEIVFHKENT